MLLSTSKLKRNKLNLNLGSDDVEKHNASYNIILSINLNFTVNNYLKFKKKYSN